MGPVALRLCDFAEIPPQPVMLMVIFSSNLGGLATPIGYSPNLLIINYEYFKYNVGLNNTLLIVAVLFYGFILS